MRIEIKVMAKVRVVVWKIQEGASRLKFSGKAHGASGLK
jgi:hypothetical protein